MPPINPKIEAQRLQQAKAAIKKMKQKRNEDNRGEIRKARSTVKDLALKFEPDFMDNPQMTSENVNFRPANGDLGNLVTKRDKQSTSGRVKSVKKKVVSSSLLNGASSELSIPVSLKVDSVLIGKKKSKRNPVGDVAVGNGVGSILFSSNAIDGPDSDIMPFDVGQSTDVNSPFVATSQIGKSHHSKKKNVLKFHANQCDNFLSPSQNDDEPVCILNDSNRPAVRSSKVKVKRMKRLNRKIGSGKKKEGFVPMSIKMKSGNVQGPIFIVTHDDSSSPELKEREILSTRVSRKKVSDSSLSAFSVTTVSERNLPSDNLTDNEDSDSDSENGMLLDESLIGEESILSDGGSVTNAEGTSEEMSEKLAPFSNDWSKAEFHFVDGDVVLNLKHPSTFVFCGQVEFEVLKGSVEILGYCITPDSGSHTAFSARGSSLLSVQTVLGDNTCPVSNILKESSLLATIASEGNEGDAMLLMKKSESTLPQFLEQYVNVKLFPSLPEKVDQNSVMKASKRLQCLCYPPSGSHVYQKGEDWDSVCRSIGLQSGCTVICGGKGVGKSTMLRFLLNRFLSSGNKKVLLVDFDPGQTELTVPGCVSISLVDNPLLGPNFTHLQEPLKCLYVGDVNVSNCVSRYIDACLAIINYWKSDENLREIPCVVNTMGFNKGLGVSIMVQILSLVQPTNVIQVQSKFNSRNYPEQLTVEYVKRMCSSSPFRLQLLSQGHVLSCPSTLNYVFHCVASVTDTMSDHCDTLGISARPAREIVILSYLSKIAKAPNFSLLETAPLCCPLDALYFNICHENVPPSVTLSAFNASLVALCSATPNEESIIKAEESRFPSIISGRTTADCLGFGIVRGIDMETQNIYLLTPVPQNILDRVNCLVLGAVCLPQSVYLTPPKEPGLVPYVVTTGSQHAAQPSKRAVRFNRLIASN